MELNCWPKVSVVVVNWNGAEFLHRCLSAVSSQTVCPHEIILLDNASTDNSLEVARQFPAVRLLVQENNLGFAGGNNLAVNSLSADIDWVVLLNPDAFPEPNWLQTLLLAAEAHPQFHVFGSHLLLAANPALMDGAGDDYHISGLVWRRKHGIPFDSQDRSVYEIFSPCAAAAMYMRSAFDSVGGFDGDYFCYVEDIDLGFRLRLAGYRCLQVPSSVVHHVGSGTTGGQRSDFSVYYGHRNLTWTFVKNMPGLLFWLFLPLHVAMCFVSFVVMFRRRQGAVFLSAKKDALMSLPLMWKKRQLIQRKKVVSIYDVLRVMKFWF